MAATVKATMKFDAQNRAKFEAAVQEFVPNVEQLFGWKNRGVHLQAEQSLCTLEWELESVADLGKGAEFEANEPNKPAWWTQLNECVVGERIELIDGENRSCLLDTLA